MECNPTSLDAARDGAFAVVTWSVLLVAALVVIVALARAGSALFWRTTDDSPTHEIERRVPLRSLAPSARSATTR